MWLFVSLHGVPIFTYLLTHSMQQSLSWEANRFSASKETPRILWKTKVHHRVHNSTTPVCIPSQMKQVRSQTTSISSRSILVLYCTKFPLTEHSSPYPLLCCQQCDGKFQPARMVRLLLWNGLMCLRTGTDIVVGPEGWKVRGDLVQDNIKVDLEEMEVVWERTDFIWIGIQTRVVLLWTRWWIFVFHKMRSISLEAENLLASQERLCCMEWVSK